MFGVLVPGRPAAGLTFAGLQVLQHRGEESAGIAISDGAAIACRTGAGLVSQVFDQPSLQLLTGHLAIGHTRYSTSGSPAAANAQPVLDRRGRFAIAHNGNLLGFPPSANGAEPGPVEVASDSHLLAAALSRAVDRARGDLVAAASAVLPGLRGAFTLLILDRGRLLAARDRHGFRPLTLGRVSGGWVVASESAAIEAVGGEVIRTVAPGELLVIGEGGPVSLRWAPAQPRACVFEYVYLARSDSVLDGRSVYEARHQAGALLARESPAPAADLVVGVPDSGIPAALGFAAESGLPYAQGFVRSPYVGRTFIQPLAAARTAGLRLKLAPISAVVRGRRVVVVDDSIVRGSTQRLLTQELRQAGAAAVHLRIASPPIRWPCFFGFDFATTDQLIGAGRAAEEIRAQLGADSLAYLSLPGLAASSGQPIGQLCCACMDGRYPVFPDERDRPQVLTEAAGTCR